MMLVRGSFASIFWKAKSSFSKQKTNCFQVDIFAMQNWEHVTFLMDKLHCRPSKSHDVDFSRVRLWTLDEMSPMYRQTLLFASTPMVEMVKMLFIHVLTSRVGFTIIRLSKVSMAKNGKKWLKLLKPLKILTPQITKVPEKSLREP